MKYRAELKHKPYLGPFPKLYLPTHLIYIYLSITFSALSVCVPWDQTHDLCVAKAMQYQLQFFAQCTFL